MSALRHWCRPVLVAAVLVGAAQGRSLAQEVPDANPAPSGPASAESSSRPSDVPVPSRPSAPARAPKKASGTGERARSSSELTPRLESGETAQALRITLGLTLLALVPALLVCLTPFLRTIIVLSMLRHGIGMNETPPNTVLIGLSLFLTLFTMSPVLQRMNQDAIQPFMAGSLSIEEGYQRGMGPLREFMIRQTREQDLALMVELSKSEPPRTMEDISNVQLVPAYMLSELRSAFQIGFVVLLPFLLIDLVVSSILMALGMMMMPPTAVSLPLKIMMFVLVDGWSLLVQSLVGSFH